MVRNFDSFSIFEKWEEDAFENMRLYTIHEHKDGRLWKRKLAGPITKKEYFKRILEGAL